MAKLVSPLTGTLQSLKRQFIDKEKLLKSSLNVQQKRISAKRSNAERERFINYENLLERTLSSVGKPIKKVTKKLGFLDSLKTFITKVLLGFIALRLSNYLPQLLQVGTFIFKIGNSIIELGGSILNGLITFVDYGYKAYSHAKDIVGKIGGEKAIQSLEKATGESTKVMNQILIASMIFSDFNIFEGLFSGSKVYTNTAKTITQTVETEVAATAAERVQNVASAQALGPLASGGIVAGAGLLLSAAGEGIFQIAKWTKGLKSFSGPASSLFSVPLAFLEGAGTVFDILGAPFRYGIELVRGAFLKLSGNKKGLDEQFTNLGKFDARVRENLRRFSGIFSPLFDFFGRKDIASNLQSPGSFGSFYGKKAVKDMGYYGGGKVIKVRKYASGGFLGMLGGIGSSLGGIFGFGGGDTKQQQKEKKKVDIPRKQISKPKNPKVGGSTGGETGFAKVFPGASDLLTMNRRSYMTNSYNIISDINYLGPVMSLTSKALLGDQVSKFDYDSAAESLSDFMLTGLANRNPTAYQKLISVIQLNDLSRNVSRFLMNSMSGQFGTMLGLLRNEIGLDPVPMEGGPNPAAADDECACPDPNEQFVTSGNAFEKALLETISAVEGTAGPDGYRTMFGGGKFQAPPWKHPDTVVRSGGYASAAAGKYQFMPGTWANAAKALGLSDFSPANQDKAALWLVKNRGVNPSAQLTVSDFEILGKEWAGLSPYYGQTKRTAGESYRIYTEKLKHLGASPSTAKISPGSPASNVDPCVCDPETPDGDPGSVSLGGGITGVGNVRFVSPGTFIQGMTGRSTGPHFHIGPLELYDPEGDRWLNGKTNQGLVEAQNAAFLVSKALLKANTPHLFSNANIWVNPKSPPDDATLKKYVAQEQRAHMGRSMGSSFGGLDIAGSNGIRLPLAVGNVVSSIHGFGNSARILGTKAFVGHGAPGSTASRESGGPTLMGGMRLLHKGEYVIDKDSVDLYGGDNFFRMINGIENENQRKEKSSSLIQHLSKYTGRKIDQRPVMVVDDEEDILIPSPPIYIPMSSSAFGGGGSDVNVEQDRLELRA